MIYAMYFKIRMFLREKNLNYNGQNCVRDVF